MQALPKLLEELQQSKSEFAKTMAVGSILSLSREESNIQEIALFAEFLSTAVRELEAKLRETETKAWEPRRRRSSLRKLAGWVRKSLYGSNNVALLLLQTLAELSQDELASQFMFDCPGLVDAVMDFVEIAPSPEVMLACLVILGNLSLEPGNKRMLFKQFGVSDLLLQLCPDEDGETVPNRFLLHRSLAGNELNRNEMLFLSGLLESLLACALHPSKPQVVTLAKISLISMLPPLGNTPQQQQIHRNVCGFWQAVLAVWTLRLAKRPNPIHRLPSELVRMVFVYINP
ncbi:hypothetical protein BASA81_000100 [Batrachochytrium salamandrivorans]|nr:hypothetical protein BASA81_000100 [Batrachochytrium salamandrivorans]